MTMRIETQEIPEGLHGNHCAGDRILLRDNSLDKLVVTKVNFFLDSLEIPG